MLFSTYTITLHCKCIAYICSRVWYVSRNRTYVIPTRYRILTNFQENRTFWKLCLGVSVTVQVFFLGIPNADVNHIEIY